MIEWILFLVFSVGLAAISRSSLRIPASHGFYRYFAWECILGLVILNAHVWFSDPFSIRQIISWVLLLASIPPVVAGVRQLRSEGKPQEGRHEEQLLAFEKTSTLVTTGLYGYIRHPLYCSLLLLTWGIFFKDPAPFPAILAAAATAFLYGTAKADERECVHYFGPAYREYMTHTKMFIPFLF